MQHYYVNRKPLPNGDHEVHVPRCAYLPEGGDGMHLGAFTRCSDAVEAANAHFDKVAACKVCCNSSSTG